MEVLFVIYKL